MHSETCSVHAVYWVAWTNTFSHVAPPLRVSRCMHLAPAPAAAAATPCCTRRAACRHFYIYDDGSKDEMHQVLQPYERDGVVTSHRIADLWPLPDKLEVEQSRRAAMLPHA